MEKKISEIIENITFKKVGVGITPYVEIGDVDIKTKEVNIKNKPSVSGAVLCPSDSVIISRVRPNRGAIAFIQNEVAITSAFTILKADKNICLPKFLYYYLAWNESFFSFLQSRSTGITYPTVKEKEILNYSISYLPDLAEQERLIELLEEAQSLKRKRTDADRKTASFIDALFVKMFGDLESNSKKWPLIKLDEKEIADFRYGTSAKCDYEPSGVPVLRIPNVLGESINTNDLKYGKITKDEENRLILKDGDLLFVRTNGNPDYVGRCAVFDLPDEYIFASYLIRVRLDRARINPWFLASYLRTTFGRRSLIPVIRTTAGQSNLSVEGIKNILIPLPPVDSQNEFAEIFKEIQNLKKRQKVSHEKINSISLSLIDHAFNKSL